MSVVSELPSNWFVAPLSDIAKSAGGGTPSKADPAYWTNGTIPWVSPKDMKTFKLTASEDQVTPQALDRLSLIPSNSVLVVVRSGILSRTLPVALNKPPVTINQDMRAFVPERGISPSYLAWQLIANEQDILSSCSKHGTTVASIEGPAFARFLFAIAPTNEQTGIVAKLEELLSDLDAGVAELKAGQKKLVQYRQSLIKAAVEGALTADWRKHNTPPETGAQLLQRILTERRARWEAKQLAKFKEQGKTPPKDWQTKYREPLVPDTSELPDLPSGWCWATTQLVGEVLLGRQRAPQYLTGRWPRHYLRVANIKDDRIDFSDVESMDFDQIHFDKYRLLAGDILVSEGQSPEHVGQSAIFRRHHQPLCFQKTLHRFRSLPGVVLPEFAQLVFRTHVCTGVFRAVASITTNIAHLTLEKFEVVRFPLPPLAEQIEIVAAADLRLSAVKAMERSLTTCFQQSNAQRQNILRAAFSGQLVPQDPNDEPASVLLERIRAEREARGAMNKPRGRKAKELA